MISIGSRDDSDNEGARYCDDICSSPSCVASEVVDGFPIDIVLDIRSMPGISDESHDCIYCSGVLEHVDEFITGLNEVTMILRSGSILLLGLPFRQALHMQPYVFWRFTKYGISYMLKNSYIVKEVQAIDADDPSNPATYWTYAIKLY